MIIPTAVGSMNFNVLRSLIKKGDVLKLNRGAEIGVLYGDTSAYLLKELPTLTLLSVDPYIAYEGYVEGRSQNQLSEYERVTREKLAQFGERSIIIKKFSLEASKEVPDGSLDFVFVDANHEYQSVKEDMAAWYPKVRKQGLFAGHDYKSFGGVTQAVNEFAAEKKLQGFHTPIESDIWFFVPQ